MLSFSLNAAEPWADPNLAVTNGLALWFDATTLKAAAEFKATRPPSNGIPLASWPDGSGNKRDLAPPSPEARPILEAPALPDLRSVAVVRFDGVDDRMVRKEAELSLNDFTLFVMASPHSNRGGFRGFFSANASGKNDYRTGLNLDQGAGSQAEFNTVNIEGLGFSGMQNLLDESYNFQTFHGLTVASSAASKTVQLFVDGRSSGLRSREPGSLSFEEIRLGARHYSNTSDPTFDSGFFHGDLAEVLLFDRTLTDPERQRVESYLQKKHARLLELKGTPPPNADRHPELNRVRSGPIVRMLSPGFVVQELPVQLSNINYLEYAPDGRLFALAYDGRIHVLRDINGDGLEDKAEIYWDQSTLKVPVSMAVSKAGVYVTSSRKLSLLRDTDGDGRADVEEIAASGWVLGDDPSHGGGIDAMAVAVDAEGNVYFGLGCADYTNAYRVRDGRSQYDLKSERGTILKLSADFKTREIVCTGIRFPYTLAFNQLGDLFCTDQEGETWLPGGNPLDELNQIIPGRHYGFPPRHPVHLPNGIDEPPVVAFGPQHQSTCGMEFNEVRPGRKPFGPAFWEGDAIVAGYSRGKVWRAKLAKTPTGYVGKEQLILASRMLLPDVAISPNGELVVACHSGGPDWGSGPAGLGKLFKISYRDRTAPQPVTAWTSSPLEVRVAFDKPLDPGVATNAARMVIEYGESVRAADRYEVLHPPYKVVQEQLQSFRGKLAVSGAQLSSDRRTLILATAPHPQRATFALTLPGAGTNAEPTDLTYDFNGVAAVWEKSGRNAAVQWSGWMPHLDIDVSRAFTVGSAEHERLWGFLEQEGELKLGAKLKLPVGPVILRIEASQRFDAKLGGQDAAGTQLSRRWVATMELNSTGDLMDFSVRIKTSPGSERLQLHTAYHTPADPTERPLPLGWIYVPWTPPAPPKPSITSTPPPFLAGGDFEKGKTIFFGETARCSQCHTIRGEGSKVGPDLSNLIHKDAASVWRDIAEPNAAINPDFVSYSVVLKSGVEHSGLVQMEGADQLRVVNAANTQGILFARSAVSDLRPASVSIMPSGLDTALGESGMKDLVTFLINTSAPPASAPSNAIGLPKRTKTQVDALLDPAAEKETPITPRRLYIVLVAGPKDHGPGEHDYPLWQQHWERLFHQAANVRVSTAQEWPVWDQWLQADLVVFYYWNHDWNETRLRDLDRHLARGRGVVALHSATIADKNAEQLAVRLGLAWQGDRGKFRHGPLDLKITASPDHPMARGLPRDIHFHDESYWPMIGDESKVQVLATAMEENKPRPMLWTYEPGKGRVFCSILGHYSWTFDDPFFRALLLRGMAWAAGERLGRFDELIVAGVKGISE